MRCLGDSLCIVFRHDLPDNPSNLHFHGMSVSPQGNSDNVFVHVHPGEQFQVKFISPPLDGKDLGFFGITRTPMDLLTSRSSAACQVALLSTAQTTPIRS
jgi:hypothetical protein